MSKFFDDCLNDSGPFVIRIKTPLVSVGDTSSPIFPPTYPKQDKSATYPKPDKSGPMYNISKWKDGSLCCDLDSIGSQANRMEGLFKKEYSSFVPQVICKINDISINLLDLGHRIADGFIQCTDLASKATDIIKQYQSGNTMPLAIFAPTSILFGFWDSRGTGVRCERVIQSTIRAYDIKEGQRSAQFLPMGDITDEETEVVFNAMGFTKKKLCEGKNIGQQMGLIDVPSAGKLGGIFVHGDIFRESIVHVHAIRKLLSLKNDDSDLRQYILALAVLAATANTAGHLRQGCDLMPNLDESQISELCFQDGRREPIVLSGDDCINVVKTFNVCADEQFTINTTNANAWKKARES